MVEKLSLLSVAQISLHGDQASSIFGVHVSCLFGSSICPCWYAPDSPFPADVVCILLYMYIIKVLYHRSAQWCNPWSMYNTLWASIGQPPPKSFFFGASHGSVIGAHVEGIFKKSTFQMKHLGPVLQIDSVMISLHLPTLSNSEINSECSLTCELYKCNTEECNWSTMEWVESLQVTMWARVRVSHSVGMGQLCGFIKQYNSSSCQPLVVNFSVLL